MSKRVLYSLQGVTKPVFPRNELWVGDVTRRRYETSKLALRAPGRSDNRHPPGIAGSFKDTVVGLDEGRYWGGGRPCRLARGAAYVAHLLGAYSANFDVSKRFHLAPPAQKRPFTEYEVVDNTLHVSWRPSARQQSRLDREGLLGFFRFTFQLDTGGYDDVILISGGHFAQFFNPPSTLIPMSKHIIFVLSFFKHLLEAWDAVSAILERLEPSDFLTIVYHERGEPKLWGANRCTGSSMEQSLSAIVPASHDNKVRAKAFLRTGIDLYGESIL
uniref:Uncharacterized protein n=1 Tax=Timema poppense TaxID=170557 RepID=A0A7R9HEW6_TIMPO|nr:unnamed protein product [Timema poppensis]